MITRITPLEQAQQDTIEKLGATSKELLFALRHAQAELLSVLGSINNDAIHHDGDDFHDLMGLISKAIARATGEAK